MPKFITDNLESSFDKEISDNENSHKENSNEEKYSEE